VLSSILKCVAVALVVAAVLVPAAAAKSHHRGLKLALVPLQRAQLGPAGASFALDYGSGSIGADGSSGPNGGVIDFGLGNGTRGLVGGYALDYGDSLTGSAAVTEIRTSVEEFKTRAEARKALAAARFEERFFAEFLGSPGVHVTVKKVMVKPSWIGQRRFGYRVTRAAENLNPIVSLDEQVVAGRFLLDLTVTAGSASAVGKGAPHLLFQLHRRLRLLLGGHPIGKRPKLPPQPREGQAPGGPDLSGMVIQPSDVGMSHAVNLVQGYDADPPALSDFLMLLSPAGTYDDLTQQIGWWPTATEATYAETYGAGSPFGFIFISIGFAARGDGETVTPVDLSSLDDPATGFLVTGGGQSEAFVTMTSGQAGESIVGSSDGTLTTGDVLSLAQAAANRLDAGLGP
jgi:hypothetical protein